MDAQKIRLRSYCISTYILFGSKFRESRIYSRKEDVNPFLMVSFCWPLEAVWPLLKLVITYKYLSDVFFFCIACTETYLINFIEILLCHLELNVFNSVFIMVIIIVLTYAGSINVVCARCSDIIGIDLHFVACFFHNFFFIIIA